MNDLQARPVPSSQSHVIVECLDDVVALDDAQSHHLVRVHRFRGGETVTATDLRGRWRAYGVNVTGKHVHLEAFDPAFEGIQGRPTRLLLAATKGSKPDLVVRMATELGVHAIDLVISERSVVRWDDAKARQIERRLSDVAAGAVRQSRRVTAPQISVGAALVALVGDISSEWTVLIADPGGQTAQVISDELPGAPICVAVGPEGGFSPDELTELSAFRRLRLGAHVLRAETAPIAALGALSGVV